MCSRGLKYLKVCDTPKTQVCRSLWGLPRESSDGQYPRNDPRMLLATCMQVHTSEGGA